jgi:hypothetical protein
MYFIAASMACLIETFTVVLPIVYRPRVSLKPAKVPLSKLIVSPVYSQLLKTYFQLNAVVLVPTGNSPLLMVSLRLPDVIVVSFVGLTLDSMFIISVAEMLV